MKKNKTHILVVDDDDRIRELIKQYLKDSEYIISTAQDALSAKKKISYFQFELFFLEVKKTGKKNF